MKCGRWFSALVLLLAMAGVGPFLLAQTTAPSTAPTTAPSAGTRVAHILLEAEPMDEFTRDALKRRFAEAREQGFKTIILEINSPGGLVAPSLEISQFLKAQDDLHITSYIGVKAYSAAAMAALATNEIVMARHAYIGAAAPILVGSDGGLQNIGETERAKFESPILEDFRDSATRNGYNVLVAEAMVSLGRAVYFVENDQGERRIVDQATYEKLTADGAWKPVANVRNPIDGPDSLLTLNGDLAHTLGMASVLAASVEELASQRGWTIGVRLVPGTAEQMVGWLSSTGVRALLFTVLMVSVYIALHTPGHGGAEAIALIALSLLLGVPMLTGYAQWWEIIVILLGIVLLAVEIFVTPGFGVLGITGIVMIVGGLVMTFIPAMPNWTVPHWDMSPVWTGLQNGLMAIVGGLFLSLIAWFWLSKYLPSLPYLNRLILTPQATVAEGAAPPPAPPQMTIIVPVGAVGRAVTDLRPAGSAEFVDNSIAGQQVIDVVSDAGFIRCGDKVEVCRLEGDRVIVKSGGESA